jgi:hypothetical protein
MIEESRTEAEHIRWCKSQAHALVERGLLASAVANFGRHMKEHPDTRGFANSLPMSLLIMDGMNMAKQGNLDGVRKWIDGFSSQGE